MSYPDKVGTEDVTWTEAIGMAAMAANSAHNHLHTDATRAWAEVANAWTAIAVAITQKDQAASQRELAEATTRNVKALQQSLAIQREGMDLLATELQGEPAKGRDAG